MSRRYLTLRQLQDFASDVSPTVGTVQTTHLEQQRSHSIMDTGGRPVSNRRAEDMADHT